VNEAINFVSLVNLEEFRQPSISSFVSVRQRSVKSSADEAILKEKVRLELEDLRRR